MIASVFTEEADRVMSDAAHLQEVAIVFGSALNIKWRTEIPYTIEPFIELAANETIKIPGSL